MMRRPASNCHCTRSRPVTISVTGCSTCNRVFLRQRRVSSNKRTPTLYPHFHEIKLVRVVVKDELHRPRTDVLDGFSRLDSLLAQVCSQFWREARRRCFFDDLLVPSLDGTVSLPKANGISAFVGEYLDFDMPWMRDVLLDQHSSVAE